MQHFTLEGDKQHKFVKEESDTLHLLIKDETINSPISEVDYQ